jgi:RNA polymerase sigma-70 factor (family 1)
MKIEEKEQIDFKNIYVTYYSRMKHFAQEYILSEEDAENIVQDVFLEVWNRREALIYHVNLIAFLFNSVKNKCLDYLRHKVIEEKAVMHIQEEFMRTLQIKYESLEAFDEELFSDDDIEAIITKAINSLPEKCREIFIKSKIEGKKQKEIAEELGVSINTIETQMGIAYKKLKEELKDLLPLLIFLFG